MAAWQSQKLIPADANWASVVLSAPVNPDELMAVATSFDQTLRYGAQTPFNDQLAGQWEAGMWEVDSTHDSLVTVTNGGDKPVHAELTILYNHGTEHYRLKQSLAPDEQMLLDFGKLIRDQIADSDGHTLPPDLMMGTYRIKDLSDPGRGSLYEGKITVEKTYGHAHYGCAECCGVNPEDVYMLYNPIGVGVGSYATQSVMAPNACEPSDIENITGDFPNWGTDDASIATVKPAAQVNGISAGSTTHFASGEAYAGEGHSIDNKCPQDELEPTAGTNVTPTVTISGPQNIPMLQSGAQGADSITVTATGNPTGGTYSWTALSGGSNITILDDTSQSAILQSVAVGTYTVQVTYTVNNKSGTATTVGRVQQPGSLGVISNTTPTFNCGSTGLPAYNTIDRSIQYQVLDTSSSPIPVANMDASETTLNVISNTCNVTGPSPTTDAPTLSNGYFLKPDTLQLCSAQCLPANSQGGPSGSCTMTVAQTWSVNGYTVKSDTLTYTCPGPPTGAP